MRLIIILVFSITILNAQYLPNYMTKQERAYLPNYVKNISSVGITLPPASAVRSVAEWEEMQAIVISWISYKPQLTEIVRAAVEECKVYILTTDSASAKNYLQTENVDITNVKFINYGTNSVWIRDYAVNNIYTNNVDSLLFLDWIYNRPRPRDDTSASPISDAFNIPLYQTTQAPTDLVNTGGNYFTDGFGTAFCEELILEENQINNDYDVTPKTEAEIDTIMKHFMGINKFIKFPVLPYDGIHHIDMHMKMLDEETILCAEYPSGIADGPQIEANLQNVLANENSVFGDAYKVVRIPSPPDLNGDYPDGSWNSGYYYTYTNSLIINKTIIVPTYYQQYDTTALRIYREAMPGYNVVGVDCDDDSGPIFSSGAIHCITHEIATTDPLLISHKRLSNTDNIYTNYEVKSKIMHRSGINSATLYYKTDLLEPYQSVTMNFTNTTLNEWTGYIPVQTSGTRVYYYIQANANSGKTQVRPMPAPEGYWSFYVLNTTNITSENAISLKIFNTQNYLKVLSNTNFNSNVIITNMLGQQVLNTNIYFEKGENSITLQNYNLNKGIYLISISYNNSIITNKFVVK